MTGKPDPFSFEQVVTQRVVAISKEDPGIVASPVVKRIAAANIDHLSHTPPKRWPVTEGFGSGSSNDEQQMHEFPA